MQTQQLCYDNGAWDQAVTLDIADPQQVLVLLFGNLVEHQAALDSLYSQLPQAHFIGATTSGEISQHQITDNGLVATILAFKHTQIRLTQRIIKQAEASYDIGAEIATELQGDDLKWLLVLSDGLHVFGSDLTQGLVDNLPDTVAITGGLAGDNFKFQQTFILAQDQLLTKQVVAVGLYGHALEVSHGSRGGWLPFGPERMITAAQGHQLFELDNQPALAVYKEYLGDMVEALPASGLRFPLEISQPGSDTKLVRTMLAVDEQAQSITFAGGISKGATARLMRANAESIINGAASAIDICLESIKHPQVAILISCIGRKQLLKQMTGEEVDVVKEQLNQATQICGFYSYGEIAPFDNNHFAELHNQTMTITCLFESCTDY
ncbi:FIST signal transduction protein [Shewanella sp. NIFS-20-20]|uniref:FIST signal transduction protein n=1 Tax=Shewanella sp. NIFS-20-20 TaxID=2853806 RepID=UPI001C43DA31|nr:FIST N-terminal domain-containing protein [Shewanella sp. NIFS-20-20]MBV7316146.1 FIST C-terminal domain-containing protein [Shewanella sp. NIFS-20-20]